MIDEPAPRRPAPRDPVAAAVTDLAHRLGVAADEIAVAGREERTWRDGSLGCPQPGMRYTQALVDGYLIVLRHGDDEYHYHGRPGRPPFLCTKAKY